MKKILVIFLISFLILFTAIIKNSTKRFEDEIFVKKENVRSLKKELENVRLEHDYLSSAEKLIEFQGQYFEDVLSKKDIKDIKIINNGQIKFEIEKLN
tara:strand:- start:322 stop:615 length:294 start_codon:yes stop_codon:yes gene_type:complete